MQSVACLWDEDADTTLGLPSYASAGAAGADLRANFPAAQREGVFLQAGARLLVPTGLRLALPEGCEAQVRPRSGLALRHGVTVLNSPGTIDADYRGAVSVILHNLGDEAFHIAHGARIAQLIIAPVMRASFALVSELEATPRGAGGFGSTGGI